jgi:hypothetical protein
MELDVADFPDGVYIFTVKDGQQFDCTMLTEGEAGIIATYRVQRFMANQSKDKLQ